jgi:hypothetical protein
MGCDIHLWVEVRENKEGTWRPLADAVPHHFWALGAFKGTDWVKVRMMDPRERRYGLFALVANVRNYNELAPFSFAERGLPADLADHTWSMRTGVPDAKYDLHSHSWATLREITEAPWPEEASTLDFHTWVMALKKAVEDKEDHPFIESEVTLDDVRIIYAFDN